MHGYYNYITSQCSVPNVSLTIRRSDAIIKAVSSLRVWFLVNRAEFTAYAIRRRSFWAIIVSQKKKHASNAAIRGQGGAWSRHRWIKIIYLRGARQLGGRGESARATSRPRGRSPRPRRPGHSLLLSHWQPANSECFEFRISFARLLLHCECVRNYQHA